MNVGRRGFVASSYSVSASIVQSDLLDQARRRRSEIETYLESGPTLSPEEMRQWLNELRELSASISKAEEQSSCGGKFEKDEHLLGVEGTVQADGTLYLHCNLG